jgi:phosphatidylglycerophosphate synthase
MVEAALIRLPSRANEPIFGRALLERLIILCRRAGIDKVIIEAAPDERHRAVSALANFHDDPAIQVVETLDSSVATANLKPNALCVRFTGNLVLAHSQLARAVEEYLAHPNEPLRILSADPEHGGQITVGTMEELAATSTAEPSSEPPPSAGYHLRPGSPGRSVVLPFALNGRREDREEAEIRLAQAVRHESVETDALMARMVDRRLSWHISLWLARTRVTPNQVTIANTAFGFGCAALLASDSYWLRLCGAVLFLVSITVDGVDGELARLRMLESRFGARLDVLTDNLVHVAIFVGMAIGCYRQSESSAYLYVLALLLAGFGACAVSVNHALSVAGDEANRWIRRVERATGRDFAYILVILAIFNRLFWFMWSAAFGTHLFALSLWWLTSRFQKRTTLAPIR